MILTFTQRQMQPTMRFIKASCAHCPHIRAAFAQHAHQLAALSEVACTPSSH